MALKVQNVASFWKSFNITEMQTKLDETASDIATDQDNSEDSKKKLVELSREFKKTTSEDVRKQVAPLLKSFQQEIDNLNKRSKTAETAFLNVYKQLIEMTDPLPALDYCITLEKKIGKLADLEIENKNLRETLADYNEEFKEVRNQDVTIKALKEKIKIYEDQLNVSIESKTKEVEKELIKDYAEKEKLLQETQESFLKRLNDAESKAQILQETLDQTQSELFEYKSKYDETNAAKADEAELLMNDIERENNRATLAEKEIVALKNKIAELSSAQKEVDSSSNNSIENNSNLLSRSSLEIEVATKDKEIAQLVNDVKQLRFSFDKSKTSLTNEIKSLEEILEEKDTYLEKLEKDIKMMKDYNEIKRELQVIKSIEFGDSNLYGIDTSQKPLEVLLLEKNKTLQNDNTTMKQLNADLLKKADHSETETNSLKQLVSEQKELILQLEKDLSSVNSLSTLYRGEGEGSSSMPEIVAEAIRSSTGNSPPPLVESTVVGGGAPPDFTSAAESLLPIVSSQRERFKQRNEELEIDITLKGQHIITLQNELDSLRADNIKLYEKIRFLQSYSGQRNDGNTGAESRYVSQYEEALDPFSSFSRKEKMRKYASLSPFEKIVLSLGRFILGNKTARTITFLYSTLVHCLIFLVLYQLAHTESCKRDFASECAQKFAEHMQQVHGDHPH